MQYRQLPVYLSCLLFLQKEEDCTVAITVFDEVAVVAAPNPIYSHHKLRSRLLQPDYSTSQ